MERVNAIRLCRRLPFSRADAGWQLACSEAVLQSASEASEPTIRWYTVTPDALFIGASQRPDVLDSDACRSAAIAAYKRSAGGTVVLADGGMLGCDVVLPAGDPLLDRDLTQSYRWLGEVWAAALRRLRLPAQVVSLEEARQSSRRHDDAAMDRAADLTRPACFGGLSPFEVVLAGGAADIEQERRMVAELAGERRKELGPAPQLREALGLVSRRRKVVGLAQVRRRQGALFQMAVLLSWDAARASSLLAAVDEREQADRSAALRERAVGLNDGRAEPLAITAIASAVEDAMAAYGLRCIDGALDPAERSLAERLAAERYAPLAL